jgi:membrane AbrB-like protein
MRMNAALTAPAMALLLSVVAGFIAKELRIPLPWMVGPMLAMVAVKMAGMKVHPPRGGRELGQLLIGTTIGLFFTPAVLHEVSGAVGLMLVAGLASIAIGYASALLVSPLAGVDRTSAFFGSVPGGAAEMVLLGERYGTATEFIAMAQSLRMMLVVLIIPPLFTLFDVSGSTVYAPPPFAIDFTGLALLFLISGCSGLALQKMGAPTPWMLGPLLCTVVVTAFGMTFSSMPLPLSNAGQCLIGCALGCKLERDFLLRTPRMLMAAVAGVALTLLLSAGVGAGLGALGGIDIPTMILATAPGGIAEMSITAKVLKLGVPLVTGFHVARLLMLITLTAPVFRFMMILNRRKAAGGNGPRP